VCVCEREREGVEMDSGYGMEMNGGFEEFGV
jgi:hypothetical protein